MFLLIQRIRGFFLEEWIYNAFKILHGYLYSIILCKHQKRYSLMDDNVIYWRQFSISYHVLSKFNCFYSFCRKYWRCPYVWMKYEHGFVDETCTFEFFRLFIENHNYVHSSSIWLFLDKGIWNLLIRS